jgi:hypothetical protein
MTVVSSDRLSQTLHFDKGIFTSRSSTLGKRTGKRISCDTDDESGIDCIPRLAPSRNLFITKKSYINMPCKCNCRVLALLSDGVTALVLHVNVFVSYHTEMLGRRDLFPTSTVPSHPFIDHSL